jgi:mannose-6-phosphate isomerase
MFLPSGRVHALGAGLTIFEVQQNSDTTYRVFDWNRLGLDGKPRDLHIPQSLASIDFNDYEPSLLPRAFAQHGEHKVRSLARHPPFTAEAQEASAGTNVPLRPGKLQIIALLAGSVQIDDGTGTLALAAGQFCLVPASLVQVTLRVETATTLLRVEV